MTFTGLIGILSLLGIAYALSNNREAIKPRTVFWGIGLQLLFAVIILKIPFVKSQFSKVDNIFLCCLNTFGIVSSIDYSFTPELILAFFVIC